MFVTEIMDFGHREIVVNYDNELITIEPSEDNSQSGYKLLKIKANEGIEFHNNSGIEFERDDRSSNYVMNNISGTNFFAKRVSGTQLNHYVEVDLNLTISDTYEVWVYTENMNYIDLREPEPEPEPEPTYYKIEMLDPFDIPDSYIILYDGEPWEIDLIYDFNTGDYFEGFISHEVLDGEGVEISVKSKEGYEIDYAELLDSYYNYYALVGDSNLKTLFFEPHMDESIILDVSVSETDVTPEPEPEPPEPDPEPPELEKLPYSNIYKLDKNGMNELADYNFIVKEHSGAGAEYSDEFINYGKYITGLYAYPFNLNSNIDSTVLLGNVDTEITSKTFEQHIYKKNLGSIIIPKEPTHGVGYKNVTVDLYVPYFGVVNLDTDELVGSMVDLSININLLSGKGTLNILNVETQSVIHSETQQIGTRIPHETSENLSINIGSDVLETDYEKPFIELKVLKPDNSAKLSELHKIELNEMFDYIKDNEVMISTTATEREQRLLKDMISKGIFIRK